MKPSGSSPSSPYPGRAHCQFGVTKVKLSQRLSRHSCAALARSSTTWSMPRCTRFQLIDNPAWPPPITTTSCCSVIVHLQRQGRNHVQDSDGGLGWICGRSQLEVCQLLCRRGAVRPELRPHPFAGLVQGSPAACDELRDAVALADGQVVVHDQGRRVADRK